MCCLVTVILLLGPRLGAILWWLFDMDRWAQTFPNIILPILGIIFLPWTLLAYVFVYPGGIVGLDWLWIVLGVVFDLSSYGGGGWGNRGRFRL
jgi:hypothetical protein